MSLTIIFKSDSHIRSKEPKPPVPGGQLSLKRKITRSRVFQGLAHKVLIPWYERGKHGEAELKPSLETDTLRQNIPSICQTLNTKQPNLGIFGGDFYDLSRTTPNRDRIRQKDVYDVGRELVSNFDFPVLFLPGNADCIHLEDMPGALKDLRRLEGNSWHRIQGLVDDDYASHREYDTGNFAFKIEDCLVIGLNSVLPAEFGYEDNVNRDFVQQAINGCRKKIPVIVFTHHSPFPALPWYFQKIGEGIPAQKWLIDDLKNYSAKTQQPTLIACGHCHQWLYDTDSHGFGTLCNLPMSVKNENIGSVIKVEKDKINVEKISL